MLPAHTLATLLCHLEQQVTDLQEHIFQLMDEVQLSEVERHLEFLEHKRQILYRLQPSEQVPFSPCWVTPNISTAKPAKLPLKSHFH